MFQIQEDINADEFKELLTTDDLEIIDVRTFPEFSRKRLDRANRLIPLEELPLRVHEIDRSKKIVTLCAVGVRSILAREYLKDKGIEAASIEGGIEDCQKSGIPVIESGEHKKITLEEQARIVVGAIIFAGMLVPGLRFVLWIAGIMLIYAGISGNCYMTYLLSKLPFNKISD